MNKNLIKRVKDNISSELSKNADKTLELVILATKEVVIEKYNDQIKKAVDNQIKEMKENGKR